MDRQIAYQGEIRNSPRLPPTIVVMQNVKIA